MFKKLFLLSIPFVAIGSCFLSLKSNDFIATRADSEKFLYSEFETGKYELIGVSTEYLQTDNFRVYASSEGKNVTKIGSQAFSSCTNLNSVMLSKNLTYIAPDAFKNVTPLLYYTGSEDEWEDLNFVTELDVSFYAFDEGFINLWNDLVPTKSVCDVPESDYLILNSYYSALSVEDLIVVDAYEFNPEGHFTIKDGMAELTRMYSKPQKKESSGNFDQNTTLILVIVISLIGMTAICVFYSLKDNDIIS